MNMSSFPITYLKVEAVNWFRNIIFWGPHVAMQCMCTHTQIAKEIKFKNMFSGVVVLGTPQK